MKTILMVAALFALAVPSHSQVPVVEVIAPTPAPAEVFGVPAASKLDLFPLGGGFGKNSAFQLGIDKSATLGVCGEYDIPDHIFLVGPCRDVLILTHKGLAAAHIGGSLGYGLADVSKSHPVWGLRAGVNVGPAVNAALTRLSNSLPALESLVDYKAPQWASYLGNLTTVDFSGGVRQNPTEGKARFPYGIQLKVNVPVNDLMALITAAGGK